MSNNTEQKELWNGSLGEGFISFEDYIHKVVEPISRVAIASVGAKTGDCILDVGCGGGFTSVSFSATGASVTGVDISDKMIDQAKSKAQSIPNVSFIVADAATEVFEKKFKLQIASKFFKTSIFLKTIFKTSTYCKFLQNFI